MLVGSFSSNAYGEARSTKDADFVVQFPPAKRAVVLGALGSDFIFDDQITFETITWHTRQILKVPSIPFEIELFDLSGEPFDQSRFQRRVNTFMGGRVVWLPTAEDVIVQKLRWAALGNRGKDFLDALGVAKVRGDRLDWTYIEFWSGELGILSGLGRLKSEAGLEP
jgi:hypothetical protein